MPMHPFVLRLQLLLKCDYVSDNNLLVIQQHVPVVRSAGDCIVSGTHVLSSTHTIPWRSFRRLEILSE